MADDEDDDDLAWLPDLAQSNPRRSSSSESNGHGNENGKEPDEDEDDDGEMREMMKNIVAGVFSDDDNDEKEKEEDEDKRDDLGVRCPTSYESPSSFAFSSLPTLSKSIWSTAAVGTSLDFVEIDR